MKMNGPSHRGEWPHHAAVPEGDRSCQPALPRPRPADPVAASAGVVSESEHESLRADIRRLSTMLGRTLSHHGGPELLELVEVVRRLSRQAPESGGAEITNAARRAGHGHRRRAEPRVLPVLPAREHRRAAAPLARAAFAAPCGPPPAARAHAAAGRGVPRRAARRGAGGPGAARAAAGVHRAPHRVVAAVGAAGAAPGRRGARPRGGRRGGRARSSTCCGRPTRSGPASRRSPTRPARSAGTWSSSARSTVPDLVGEFEREARAVGFTVPDDARPLVLGSWVGGDRDGNPFVTPGRHPRGRRAERGPGAARSTCSRWSS